MVRFVGSDPTGLPLKRRQVANACEKCRRRKKRCIHSESKVHNDNSNSNSNNPSPNGAQNSPKKGPVRVGYGSGNPSPLSSGTSQTRVSTPSYSSHGTNVSSGSTAAAAAATADATTQNVRKQGGNQSPTFYGDLNPEAILMEATSLCCHRDVSAPGGVGIWRSPTPSVQNNQSSGVPTIQSSSRRAVQDLLKSYLWNHCLPCRPPPSDYGVLKRIYFERMNPIFPIFEEQALSGHLDEVIAILAQQVVSLAAAADPDATQHLRLSPDGPLLTRQEFCACLSNSVLTTLDAGLVTDRLWLTRLSAALSLYTQPTNSEEADIPAQLNSRAVHQMHTLGLQMAVDDRHEKRDMIPTIFCCLWALDRITSAFYGRACLIHERDVGWNLDDCIRRQAPPFRLLLMIVGILEQVINLYRPGTRPEDKPAIIEMPTFEQMIIDAGALRTPSSCLASIEVFYHSVAILSTQSPANITSSALPSPAVNSRRSLSADRITRIVGEEFAGQQLVYMPFIPYGVSLSLSVSYRRMRHSRVPMFRSRGKQAFRKNTLLLKSMDDMFWKSKTMVAMAEQVLGEMDRAVASLAQENGLGQNCQHQHQLQNQNPSQSQPQHQNRNQNNNNMSNGHRSEAQQEDQDPAAMANTTSTTSTTTTTDFPTMQHSSSSSHYNNNMLDVGGNGISSNEWMLFDAVPDLDVFGHFDPTFDLGAVDATLDFFGGPGGTAANNWFDWQQHQWL